MEEEGILISQLIMEGLVVPLKAIFTKLVRKYLNFGLGTFTSKHTKSMY